MLPGRAGRRKKEEWANMTLSPGGKRGVIVIVSVFVAVLMGVEWEGAREWEWSKEACNSCSSGEDGLLLRGCW